MQRHFKNGISIFVPMQRLAAVLLCAVLLFNAIGYWVVFGAMRCVIREKAEEQLRTAELPLKEIILPLDSFSGNKEISFKGELFDVVRYTKKNGVVHLYCLPDDAETALLTHAEKASQEQGSQNLPEQGAKVFKLLFSPADEPAFAVAFSLPGQSGSCDCPSLVSFYRSVPGRLATPPPRTAC